MCPFLFIGIGNFFGVRECTNCFRCSGLGHSADPVEIDDLEKFLEKTIPPEGDGQATAGL